MSIVCRPRVGPHDSACFGVVGAGCSSPAVNPRFDAARSPLHWLSVWVPRWPPAGPAPSMSRIHTGRGQVIAGCEITGLWLPAVPSSIIFALRGGSPVSFDRNGPSLGLRRFLPLPVGPPWASPPPFDDDPSNRRFRSGFPSFLYPVPFAPIPVGRSQWSCRQGFWVVGRRDEF